MTVTGIPYRFGERLNFEYQSSHGYGHGHGHGHGVFILATHPKGK
jgi:hypothetical protein